MWKSEGNDVISHHHQLHPHHPHHVPHHHLHPSATTMSQMPILGSNESTSTTPSHSLGRKKRRGMIEKRRRDRINNSLNELRRLVPAAFEKQGSAKLEKAEILQMTVDHLTMLHAKGFDAFSFDPHKFAMDYHSIGFRECASEVARYMVTVEGLDLQDPLRLRLMAHLQCYAAQREMSLKSSAHSTVWNPSAFTTPNHQMVSSSASSSMPPPPPPPLDTPDHGTWTATHGPSHHSHHLNHPHQLNHNSGHQQPATSITSNGSNESSSSSTSTNSNNQPYFTSYQAASSVKHYRPWGGELAY